MIFIAIPLPSAISQYYNYFHWLYLICYQAYSVEFLQIISTYNIHAVIITFCGCNTLTYGKSVNPTDQTTLSIHGRGSLFTRERNNNIFISVINCVAYLFLEGGYLRRLKFTVYRRNWNKPGLSNLSMVHRPGSSWNGYVLHYNVSKDA